MERALVSAIAKKAAPRRRAPKRLSHRATYAELVRVDGPSGAQWFIEAHHEGRAAKHGPFDRRRDAVDAIAPAIRYLAGKRVVIRARPNESDDRPLWAPSDFSMLTVRRCPRCGRKTTVTRGGASEWCEDWNCPWTPERFENAIKTLNPYKQIARFEGWLGGYACAARGDPPIGPERIHDRDSSWTRGWWDFYGRDRYDEAYELHLKWANEARRDFQADERAALRYLHRGLPPATTEVP